MRVLAAHKADDPPEARQTMPHQAVQQARRRKNTHTLPAPQTARDTRCSSHTVGDLADLALGVTRAHAYRGGSRRRQTRSRTRTLTRLLGYAQATSELAFAARADEGRRRRSGSEKREAREAAVRDLVAQKADDPLEVRCEKQKR